MNYKTTYGVGKPKQESREKPNYEETPELLFERRKSLLNANNKLKANVSSKPKQVEFSDADFQNFVGYWIRDTMDDWIGCTMIQFYRDNGIPKAKFYGGTQNNLREINLADVGASLDLGFGDLFTIPQDSYDDVFDTCDVEVLDNTSVRILNTLHQGYLSSDQLQSTFKIQDYDNNAAFAQFWTIWDGTSDNKAYGEIENLSKFRRLECIPPIQKRDDTTNKWDNPVNLFNYVYDAFVYLGQNQRRDDANCDQYIGDVAFEQLKNTLLTTGLIRQNTISTAKRQGKYIGVWRTKGTSSNDKNTTLRLQETNLFSNVDIVTISGFQGAYAVLNGTHNVSFLTKGSVGPRYGAEFESPDSVEHTVHIEFDSSNIAEEYNPNIHGVATIQAQHGPVTPSTEYRELLAALADLMYFSFGISTHTAIYAYSTGSLRRIDTFAALATAIQTGNFSYVTIPRRPRGQRQGRDNLYFNPVLRRGSRQSPIFDINDPFGLGLEVAGANASSKWNIDIDLKNYMEVSFNIWWTVTGPVVDEEPITGAYNGSQIRFTVAETGTTPAPLVDEFGTHEYNLYQFDENNAFVGGIVKKCYTDKHKHGKCKHKNVAYIRIANEGSFQGYDVSFRSLAFGRNDWPGFKFRSNEVAALAALLEKLNEYKPKRYIIDIRENGGGVGSFGAAWGSLFGGNRGSASTKISLDVAGDTHSTVLVNDSDIQTVNGGAVHNAYMSSFIDTDATAAIFPKAMVRGSCHKQIDVVILDNVGAGSAGDIFPHNFIGSDRSPEGGIHNIGHNVTCQIVGGLDGRLYNGLSLDCTPISNPNPYKYDGVYDYSVVPFNFEAGILLCDDTHGIICNQQPWMRPSKLVPSWYEKQWQDVGAIPTVYQYPLKSKHETPNLNDNRTWRDLALEHAITHKALN
ncbi:tail specific protease [Fadolivirus algeromassiliense]|jgi:hypothetical protein|uniref:Tail specific protease n=1 Tax=Fadolivirus FV1/VV64 TaxID=3070911 RepID=A0A7D3QWE6_9VIRU|nr:tail specific protease [Fadolivirus algeromassiliense]QKF94459.1 tail specific protease [Fadolivirus FV1/VV64]